MNQILAIQNDKFYDTPCRGYEHFKNVWLKWNLPEDRLSTVREWWMIVSPEDFGFYPQSYTIKLYNEKELLEIFPEALPIIKKNLRDLYDSLKGLEPLLKELIQILYQEVYATFAQKDFVPNYSWMTKEQERDHALNSVTNYFYNKPINEIHTKIRRLEKFIRIDEWKRKPPSTTSITDGDIAHAKEYPIENFSGEPNRAGFIHCPFHNEKTASCKIYRDQNRWHCFGCGADGDVIDFLMKKEDIDFITAIKRILSSTQ